MPRLTMFWQMFLAFGVLVVLALGVLGILSGTWVEQQALAQTENHLKTKAIYLEEAVRGREPADLQKQIEVLGDSTDTRITLIAPGGRVVAESTKKDPADLDNHSHRPEVEAARLGRFGTATRFSTTTRKNMMYVA